MPLLVSENKLKRVFDHTGGFHFNVIYNVVFCFLRIQRYHCFLQNLEKTKEKKRPRIALLDDSKASLRVLASKRVEDSIRFVKDIHYTRFKQQLQLK